MRYIIFFILFCNILILKKKRDKDLVKLLAEITTLVHKMNGISQKTS